MRIGIDIGGTKIIAGVVDEKGSVIHTKRIPTEIAKGYEGIRDDIVVLIQDIIQGAGVQKKHIEQIGIATAGQIEKESNKILFSPNLGWHNVALRDDIEKAIDVRTHIENDVNAATYGEWKFGLKGVPKDVLGIFIGTGIGGGLILTENSTADFPMSAPRWAIRSSTRTDTGATAATMDVLRHTAAAGISLKESKK